MSDKYDKYNIGHSAEHGRECIVEDGVHSDPSVEAVHTHRHSFYSVLIVREGGGTHLVDFEAYDIRPRRVFFVRPGQVHLMQGVGVTYSAVQFSEEFILSALGKMEPMDIPVFIDMKEEETARVSRIFDLLKDEYRDDLADKKIILAQEIRLLLSELQRIGNSNSPEHQLPEKMQRFKALIEKECGTIRTVAEYADRLCITPNYLNVLSQRYLGASALSLINARLALEAKRRLLLSEDDISTIARSLGFYEFSNFTKFFKRHTDFTPQDFRRAMNKIYH